MAAPGLRTDDLLALILKEQRRSFEPPPPGFLTAQQWRAKWRLSTRRTAEVLQEGLKMGVVEMKKFRVDTPTKYYLAPHYRQKSKDSP